MPQHTDDNPAQKPEPPHHARKRSCHTVLDRIRRHDHRRPCGRHSGRQRSLRCFRHDHARMRHGPRRGHYARCLASGFRHIRISASYLTYSVRRHRRARFLFSQARRRIRLVHGFLGQPFRRTLGRRFRRESPFCRPRHHTLHHPRNDYRRRRRHHPRHPHGTTPYGVSRRGPSTALHRS